jgi:ABC-type nitrate/sulfonate/bicarbonate transport system substrate-binding protein
MRLPSALFTLEMRKASLKVHMVRSMLSFVVGLICFCVVAVANSHAQTRQLKICVPDYSVGVMPLFAAKQNGYYAQEQLDVEVIAGRGNLCTMGLIAGSFQFTYSPSTFDAVVAGDIKGKVIYVAEKFLLHRLIAAPQIKRFEDLKGKRIAISAFGTLTDLLTREILMDHGLKPMQDVVLLQTGGTQVRFAALMSKNVQAALLPSQQALAAMQEGFRNLEYDPPPYLSHPLIAKNELLNNDKGLARSLLRATLKGHLFYGQRPEETLTIIQKVLGIDDRKTARETYDDEMRRYNPGGQFEPSNMKKVIDRVRETRKMERKVEIQEVFDLSMAAEAEAALKKAGWKP